LFPQLREPGKFFHRFAFISLNRPDEVGVENNSPNHGNLFREFIRPRMQENEGWVNYLMLNWCREGESNPQGPKPGGF
jgi:hypothetical protein